MLERLIDSLIGTNLFSCHLMTGDSFTEMRNKTFYSNLEAKFSTNLIGSPGDI